MERIYIRIIEFYIKIVNLFLRFLRLLLWRKQNTNRIKNICIYRLGNIGDLLCSVPAINSIRQNHPKASITLLSSPGSRDSIGADIVLKDLRAIDHIEMYFTDDIDNIVKIFKLLRKLRKYKFDYLIQLPAEKTKTSTQIRNMLFFKMMNIKYSDGFYISTVKIFPKTQERHINYPNEVQRLIYGLPLKYESSIEFPINVMKEDRSQVNKLIYKNGITDKDRIMIISHGGKAQSNYWPSIRFRTISEKWIKSGGKTIVIGGKGEFREGEEIVKNQEGGAFNFCGLFTISQSLYLINKSQFLLTIETGTVHIGLCHEHT